MNWQEIAKRTKTNSTLIYPEKISPLIESQINSSLALQRQFKYSPEEIEVEGGLKDPIGDETKSKGGGIIHRYQNRILFTPTQACSINCRYCFRKNELNSGVSFLAPSLSKLNSYLYEHPEVKEVILTGGDPLVLNDEKLKKIFDVCLKNGIEYLRFHTRTPIAIPERIDNDFLALLRSYQNKFKRLFFVLHTNHIDELGLEVEKKLRLLESLNISLLTQSVLLKGVNDNAMVLQALFEKLVEIGFTPYYLHHPDKVKGAMHFYLSEDCGVEIYRDLKHRVSGWALPHYIIDSPSAEGKRLVVNQDI